MRRRKKAQKRITHPKSPPSRADEVRARLAQLGIKEQDVTEALAAARQRDVAPSACTGGELDDLLGRFQ